MCVTEAFVKQPNLPEGRVRLAVVSGAYPEISEALERRGVTCIQTAADPRLQPQIAHHADMQVFHLNENRIFVLKGGAQALRGKLKNAGFSVAETASEPTAKYPGDVLCNALQIGDKLLANLGAIDPYIYSFAESLGLKTIHVNQGYTRCATAVVSNRAIITMDSGIYAAAQFMGLDALHISEHGILLNGYDYGFIGGCCGLIDRNTLAFTGALDSLQSGEYIRAFLAKHAVEAVELTQNRMLDIGGILPLKISACDPD